MSKTLKDARARCPVCSAPSDRTKRPFCSSMCADVDLLRWLRGGYAVPVEDADEDEDGDASRPGPGDDDQHAG